MADVQVASPRGGQVEPGATSPDDLCRICFTHLTNAVTTDCSHTFCHDCVVKWASTQRRPSCPLCKAPLERVTASDGVSRLAVAAGTTNQAEEAPDLACLDTGFFVVEVGRLLQRTQGVHDRLLRDAYGCGRKGSAASLQSLDGLSEVMGTLQSYQQTLMDDGRFDAEALMSDLYRLERAVSSLAAGRSDEVEGLDGVQGSQGGRPASGSGRALLADHWPGLGPQQGGDGDYEQGYDPGWHDDDHSDDWDEEEEHHRAVAYAGQALATAPLLATPTAPVAGVRSALSGAGPAYARLLAAHPLPTKVVTAAAGAVLSDALAQAATAAQPSASSSGTAADADLPTPRSGTTTSSGSSGQRSRPDWPIHSAQPGRPAAAPGGGEACEQQQQQRRRAWRYDAARTLRLVLFGAVVGTPLAHYWFAWLEAAIRPDSPTSAQAVAFKVLLDQGLMSPVGMLLFLASQKAMEGAGAAEVAAFVRAKMRPALVGQWTVWPTVQALNFWLVPLDYRIAFLNLVGIAWTVYMSSLANEEEPQPVEGEEAAAEPTRPLAPWAG